VQEHLIELRVGEILQVGRYQVTLLEVDGEELCVQVDGLDDGDAFAGLACDDDLLMV